MPARKAATATGGAPTADTELASVAGACTCVAARFEGFLDPQQSLLSVHPVQVSQQAGTQGASSASAAPAVHVDLLAGFQSSPDLCNHAPDPVMAGRHDLIPPTQRKHAVLLGWHTVLCEGWRLVASRCNGKCIDPAVAATHRNVIERCRPWAAWKGLWAV